MKHAACVIALLCGCVDDEVDLDETIDALTTTPLVPVADAYVRSGTYQTASFGGEPTLAIKLSSSATDNYNRQVYLKFDLSSVPMIITAKLRLYGSAGGAPEAIATELRTASDTTWSETGITWANRPTTATSLGAVTMRTSDSWHEWDVTSFLQAEQAAGRKLVTFVVIATTPSTTGAPGFRSREVAGYQPTLAIGTSGAPIPWKTYEAEAGSRHAGASLQTGTSWGEVAFEARGKRAVVLDASGEWVQWTNVAAASHATVRYSVPAGKSGTLALYVNSAQVATFALTSARMRESKPDRLPGDTVRFFDDVMVAVPGGIPAGATVRVQKAVADATSYTIDFLELETAPPPLTKPDDTWVPVTGSDGNAIRSAISTASSTSKKVWLPAGVYTVTDTITLPPGVQLRGAGMWHTLIKRNNTAVNARLFELRGSNTIRDLKIVSNLTTLVGQNVAIRGDSQSGSTIQNVWTEYISLFLGFNTANTTVRGNRVRNAYKDSIHFARASVGNLVENNTIRNSGDDSVAFVSYETVGMANNIVRYNTAEVGYWGRGLTSLGGDGNRIEANLVIDYTSAGVLVGVEEYSGTITAYATDWVIQNNTIIRCGNQVNRSYGGAIAIRASTDRPISGHMENNKILSPPFDGAQIAGYVGDPTAAAVYFRYNGIMAPATAGFVRKRVALKANSNCIHTPNPDL